MEKGVGFVVAVALAHVVGKWASIAYQGDRAGCGKASLVASRRGFPHVGSVWMAIYIDWLNAASHGTAGGVGGAEHHVFGNFRVFYHPFYSPESPSDTPIISCIF